MRVRHRHNGNPSRRIAGILALWLMVCCLAKADVETSLPPDLVLTVEEEEAAEATASFAWGHYLEIQGQGAAPEAEPHFLHALSLNPTSETILGHLVAPLYLGQKHERIVELLTPLAEQHPEAVQLQFALAQALNDTGKRDEAGRTLYRALDGTGWTEATLVRELFVHHWRAEEYKKAEKLLSKARRRRSLREQFYVEHAYATYYNARANRNDPKLSDRKRESYARNALKHAKRAVGMVEQASRIAEVAGLASMLLSLEQWEDAAELSRRARAAEHLAVPELDMVWVEALRAMGRDTEARQVLAELWPVKGPTRNAPVEVPNRVDG